MINTSSYETTHTPGSWLSEQEGSNTYAMADGMLIAVVIAVDPHPTNPGEFIEGPITRANARLIAAAPELLEALKAALQCFDEMKGRKPAFVEDSIAMGKEAITRATGAQA